MDGGLIEDMEAAGDCLGLSVNGSPTTSLSLGDGGLCKLSGTDCLREGWFTVSTSCCYGNS